MKREVAITVLVAVVGNFRGVCPLTGRRRSNETQISRFELVHYIPGGCLQMLMWTVPVFKWTKKKHAGEC